RKPDGGVQFQHNIVPVRAHSGYCARDAIGFGYCVIDGVSQLAEKVFQMIIELQGGFSRTSIAILGPRKVGYKRPSHRCLQFVHSPSSYGGLAESPTQPRVIK